MEVEREKKDKLASARKKLNEYKLNRGTATVGRSNVASTQPADVPSFYQNLNTPAASFTIFNPAAGNNNTTSGNPYYTPVVSASPVTFGESSSLAGSDVGDSVGQQNNQFLPIQQQFLTSDSNETENVHQVNPFSVSSAFVNTYTEAADATNSSTEDAANDTLESSTTSLFSPVINTGLDSPVTSNEQSSQLEQNAHTSNNIQMEQVESKHVESPNTIEQSEQVSMLSSQIPDIDTINMEQQKMDNPTMDMSAFDTPSKILNNHTHSSIFAETPQPDNNNINQVADLQKQHFTEENDQHGAPIPVFASSLFGATNNEIVNVFNIGQTSQPCLVNQKEAVPHTQRVDECNDPSDARPFLNVATSNDVDSMNKVFQPPLNGSNDGDGGLSETVGAENIASANEAMFLESSENNFTPIESNRQEEPINVISNISSPRMDLDTSETFSTVQSTLVEAQEMEMKLQEIILQTEVANNATAMSLEKIAQMKSVQEAQELQIEELRRENAYLLGRQTELTTRIEESEKLAHEFKLEKDRVKEEANTTSQALRARINSLCEENQRIVKNSTDVGVDLRAKLEEKSKQLEEMQKAVIVVSQSKMDFAGRLDHELECVKELQSLLQEKDEIITSLRTENSELQEKLKQEHQKDAIIHQLQDQARHYQVQCETLHRELSALKMKNQQIKGVHPSGHAHHAVSSGSANNGDTNHDHVETSACAEEADNMKNSDLCQCSENPEHAHHEGDDHHHDSGSHDSSYHHHHDHIENHSHDHNVGHHHDHSSDHHHHHDHSDDHHHHDHSDEHHHHDHSGDHHHDHSQHHHDGDHHHHDGDSHQEHNEKIVARRGPSDELTEIKKTLHRLEWENSSYRSEIDLLAVEAKQKRTYEEKCSMFEVENQRLKKEVEQLEHVIIQLQGENDTIGDYITLYQTQKMALKECAKEKDAHLELLSREREMLLHRLAELTALVKDLKDSKSEAGSQCADDHIHTLDSLISPPSNKRHLEGKIRDLLTEISSSSLIENFHPCAVCSGRLMTV